MASHSTYGGGRLAKCERSLLHAVFIAGRGSISTTLISNRVTLRQAGMLTVSLCAVEYSHATAGSGQISQQSAFSPFIV
jgi:hypothetical protein